MRKSVLAVCIAAAGSAAPALADTIFTANLTHSQETAQGPLLTSGGDPRPLSFGSATLTLNDEMTELSMWITVHNIDFTGTQTPNDLNDNLRAAHIHAAGPPGVNAGVVWGFIGTPFNDNNPMDVVVTPFEDGVGGTVSAVWNTPEGNNTTLDAQLPSILAGLSYLNFHTEQFRGGEIRGQILQAPDAASTLGLFGAGLSGLLMLRRNLRRAG